MNIGNFWAGESTFHTESNASKYALHLLMNKLKDEKVPWMDIQMVTPLTEQFGASEVSRLEYLELLKGRTF